MINWYEDIGELISAFNTEWFPQILQGALQDVFQYDYFLLVIYEKNKSLRIVRSDFRDIKIKTALQYLETENYIAEAMYRLFGAGELTPGLYDMCELRDLAAKLPSINTDNLSHMVECAKEEMGYRTIGWPRYLQETCIVADIDDHHCAAISLYNTGLTGPKKAKTSHLQTVYPAIASLVKAYFTSPFGKKWYETQTSIIGLNINANPHDVRSFFFGTYKVNLTSREVEIFARLLKGSTVSAIAEELCISIHTAKTHRRNVYGRIGHGHQLELMNQFNQYEATILQRYQ